MRQVVKDRHNKENPSTASVLPNLPGTHSMSGKCHSRAALIPVKGLDIPSTWQLYLNSVGKPTSFGCTPNPDGSPSLL